MKRMILMTALLVGTLAITSCGLVRNTVGTAGRTVQGVGRAVGL
jgi:predicted small secreted protein